MSTPVIHCWGLPQCDTVKKVRASLAAEGQGVAFHDFKKEGAPPERLRRWAEALGWEALLNRRGTTWRGLPAEVQASVVDQDSAVAVMAAHPSCIKRPVLEWPDGRYTVGPR